MPEWVKWEFDESTLDQLKNWEGYSCNELSKILREYVGKPLNSPIVQDLLDCIPDGVVPIKGLAKALVNVLCLAIVKLVLSFLLIISPDLLIQDFPHKKEELKGFVGGIVKEIRHYKDAFGTGDSQLLKDTWKDLEEMR